MNTPNIPKPKPKIKLPKEGTKVRAVAEHLLEHGTITSWQAIKLYHYTRLSDGIYQLKKYGWSFIWEDITENGRHIVSTFWRRRHD